MKSYKPNSTPAAAPLSRVVNDITIPRSFMRHHPSYQASLDIDQFPWVIFIMVPWLLITCGVGSISSAAAANEVVPIILIAGQSNSRGVGKVMELSPGDQTLVKNLSTGVTPSRLWNHRTQNFENVKAGVNTAVKNGSPLTFTPELFGVEVGLAHQISQMDFWDQAHIIKWGKGGATLDKRYLGTHGNWSPDFTGPTAHYPFFINQINKALETIESAGKVGVIQLLVWIQGESDARSDLGNNEDSYANAYEENLRNFISSLYNSDTFRSPQPNFSILIARIHKGLEQFANCDRYARYPGCTPFQSVDTVALAQETIEKEFSSVRIFDLNDLSFPRLDSALLSTWIDDGQLTPGEPYYGDIHYISEDLWDAIPTRITGELVNLPTFEKVPK